MFDRFTNRARQVIIMARKEADRFNHNYIGTEHLILGIIKLGQGVAANVLRKMGLDFETIRMEIEKSVGTGTETKMIGEIPLTARAKKVIELAVEEARSLNHSYVGTEHLLLGLLREGEGVGARILKNLDVDIDEVRAEVLRELEVGSPPSMDPGMMSEEKPSMSSGPSASAQPGATPALKTFGRDLTALARLGKLDPVIGRQYEIERVVQILCRRTKNNPVLIGEAGVGKTAIVEGLAQAIVNGDVPELLAKKKLITLDLALMIAGTKYRGQFEERIKAIMDEIRKDQNTLIFIDELHTIVGAGAAEGAIDASNILKPALSRGELQCIGATTLDEYRKYIEKDAALERRFQTITVREPTVDETVEILKGIRDKYEVHHEVKFLDSSLWAAAYLSDRYINGRFLPDKAIDIIDECGAKARIKAQTKPPDIKEIEKEIDAARIEKEEAIGHQDYEKAAAMRDREREAKHKLEEVIANWKQGTQAQEEEITEEEVSMVISKLTGVPISTLEEAETERLLRMEDELKKRIVGQDSAVKIVSRALRRSRANLKDPKRPIGSFIFLGPTGVGKTLLARVLAEFMFGDEEALIQVDMSEYMEKFATSRLTGSPPGYVGYEEGGQLSEQVRRRPYSVVLFDEIEKAHPDVMNILLQVLEEGKLTDNFGRNIDFRNTIIIMTSNAGTEILRKQTTMGFGSTDPNKSYDDMKDKLIAEMKKHFKPEFINRVDETIVFHQLTEEDMGKIIDIELRGIYERLTKQGLKLELGQEAKEFLIKKGFEQAYGARGIRRTISRYLEDQLAEAILRKMFDNQKTITAMVRDDNIVFE